MTKTEWILAIATALFAAQGFWQYFIAPLVEKVLAVFRPQKISAQDQALIGLLHERILDEREYYKKRYEENGEGISRARYDYLMKHILQPYLDLGGNSDAPKLMSELSQYIDER